MSEDFNKYLAIANHDIQMVKNMEDLKGYVASILYDNDKKAELLQQKENIIKEVREYIEKHKHLNWYNDSCYMNDLLEILDKGE